MRIAAVSGRLALIEADRYTDVAAASSGQFGPDPDSAYRRWNEFTDWARSQSGAPAGKIAAGTFDAPVLQPRQVFGIGLNYGAHAAESGVATPDDSPTVFTKFPSCLTGPTSTINLPSPTVDWEVELVVVIGRLAQQVSETDAWNYVAGLTVGQDISERTVQLAGPVPQFCMGKSYPSFGPIGPLVVTPDEFTDPDDLEISCSAGGRVLQSGRTSQMIFSVPDLISRISRICPLLPGDLIFTGTPPGVGAARAPQEWLRPNTTLISEIKGIGRMENPIVAGPGYAPGS